MIIICMGNCCTNDSSGPGQDLKDNKRPGLRGANESQQPGGYMFADNKNMKLPTPTEKYSMAPEVV